MPPKVTKESDAGNNRPTVRQNLLAERNNRASTAGKNKADGRQEDRRIGNNPTEHKSSEEKRSKTTLKKNDADIERDGNSDVNEAQRKRLLNRAQVPNTWNQTDLEKNIEELEAKIAGQQTYLTVLEEKLKTNDELVKNMYRMKTEPEIQFQQYKDEVGKLGDETGGYEMEIKFYNTMTETSNTSKNMAQEAFSGNLKYNKHLQKTLSLLQEKALRLHDNQVVMKCKKAARSLLKEKDREEYLMNKLLWYQDKVKQCRAKESKSYIGFDDDKLLVGDDGSQYGNAGAIESRNFSGNNTSILPSINRAGNLISMVKKDSPRPDAGSNHRERDNSLSRLPAMGKSNKIMVPRLDLSFLLDDDKKSEEQQPSRNKLLPDIRINQKITDMKHMPGPPKAPRVVKKIRPFFDRS